MQRVEISSGSIAKVFKFATVLFLLFASFDAAAINKSGVRPNVLSLPSGPGSIEGLGESFEPQLNSGTATHAVTLSVPPGRAGFTPQLTISYDSGRGNGVLGLGRRLSLPYLQRQTDKGLPYYSDWPVGDGQDNDGDGQTDEFDEFDTYVYSGGEELIPVEADVFRFENEGAFLHFRRVTEGWTVRRPDGVTLRFGSSAQSRIQGPQGNEFQWCLDQMVDTNGNTINFSYSKLDSSNQVYLQAISYNPSDGTGMKIKFLYETRPDIVADYRPGFEVKTAYRISQIAMSAAGTAVRSYLFEYHPLSNSQTVSLLASVTQLGRDGQSTLPPARFEYVPFDGANAVVMSMPSAPSLTLQDGDIDLLDINADGLPDILDTRTATTQPHHYYLNLGPDSNDVPVWSGQSTMQTPVNKFLSASDTQLVDIDGDGRTDLLDKFGNQSQYYRINSNLSWEWAGYVGQPSFSLSDPNTRLVDVNNDKLIDIMQTSGGLHYTWLNLDGSLWSTAIVSPSPNSLLKFDRSYVKLADMNGDRLLDLVQLQNGLLRYYPSKGYGAFGTEILMENPPSNIVDETKLSLVDVNGDGMSDVLHVNGSAISVWINKGLKTTDNSKGQLATPFTVTTPYPASFNTAFRLADINGNGSIDLLLNTPGLGANTFSFIDFAFDEQPYQLKSFENGIGSRTTIDYGSIVEEMVRDRDAGRRWTRGVPVPFQVVTRVEVDDGLDSNLYISQFSYHDGYYDGLEREFRGFAAAERKDVGDVSQGAPSLVTAQEFHTGGNFEVLKGKPFKTEMRNEVGDIFWSEDYTWQARTLIPGLAGDERSVVYPAQTARIRNVVEKGIAPPVRLEWEYDYDNYGNQILNIEHGRVDAGAWDDERVTISTYSSAFASGQANWILNKLVGQEIQDENGVAFARKQLFYDDETFTAAAPGDLSAGNLTMVVDWYDMAGGSVQSVRNRYDEWGNLTQTYDPLWGTEPGHYSEFLYDASFHTFPVQETIHTGGTALVATASYDAGLGVMTSSTNFDNYSTTYGYDTFGRITSIVKPGDSTVVPTISYNYILAHKLGSGGIVNWIETRQREQAGAGTVDSRDFIDGLGRSVMTRAEGESSGQVVVSNAVRFNARGTSKEEYLPYFDTGSLDYSSATTGAGSITNHYDALGRITKAIQPTGEYSRTTFAPLSMTVEDEEQANPASIRSGSAMRYVWDGLLGDDGTGRLRQADELVQTETWSTYYSYDVLDNLVTLTDAQGNRRISKYDGLSREFFVNDPDRSYMWYSYDAASNVKRTRDANGQEIAYRYDGVNRLLAEYYLVGPDPVTDLDNDGVPDSCDNCVGVANSKQRDTDGDGYGNYCDPDFNSDLIVNAADLGVLKGRFFTQDQDTDLTGDGFVNAADLGILKTMFFKSPGPSGACSSELTGEALSLYQQWSSPGSPPGRTADVTYYYDTPGNGPLTATNTRGKLSWVRDLSGETHNSYDYRDRLIQQARIINSPDASAPNQFVTSRAYDSMDRPTQIIYPDGTFITNNYNQRGLLENIPNVVLGINYNPANQLSSLELAAGTITTYNYDPRLRLSQLSTVRTNDGLTLQDLSYNYDGVSNITTITDQRLDSEISTIGNELGITAGEAQKFRETVSYNYDDRYRLTGAENVSVFGSLSYGYDRIGNMVFKSAALNDPLLQTDLGEMVYGGSVLGGQNAAAWNRSGRDPDEPPGPHALTMAGAGGPGGGVLDLSYDANGNVTVEGEKLLQWDDKNRLVFLQDGQSSANYVYDHDNIRKIKTVTDTSNNSSDTVLYIDNNCEWRDGKLAKYVYAGNSRIARSDIDGSTILAFQPEYFYISQHLGSTTLTLDPNGEVQEANVFLPYGGSRIRGSNSGSTPYLFTGKERDRESGYDYFEQRYNASSIARFLSTDPLATRSARLLDPQRWNPYSYSRNNPVVYVDPDGEFAIAAAAFGTLWVADKVYAAYEAYQDYQAIKNGETTVGEVATQRSVESGMGFVFGSLGRFGVKGVFKAVKVLKAPGAKKKITGLFGKVSKRGSASKRTTILGENMKERVIPYANKTGARTLPFGTTAEKWNELTPKQRWKLNDGALRKRINEGDKFKYIGRDPGRSSAERSRFDLTGSELLRLKDRGISYETVSP